MGPSPKGKSSLHEYLDPLTFCTSDPSTPLPIFCKNSVQMALTAAAELGADADELLEARSQGTSVLIPRSAEHENHTRLACDSWT